MIEAKACTGPCSKIRPLSDFGNSASTKDGLRYQCRDSNTATRREWAKNNPEKVAERRASIDPETRATYNRRSYLDKLYGITPEDYDNLLGTQHGCCRICG